MSIMQYQSYHGKSISAIDAEYHRCSFNSCSFESLKNTIFKQCSFLNCAFNGVYQNVDWGPPRIPQKQDLIVYKKVYSSQKRWATTILTLKIPAHAKRVMALRSSKCRAKEAIVIAGASRKCYSMYDPDFYYLNGMTLKVPNFKADPLVECDPGIHFFITREEAEDMHRL